MKYLILLLLPLTIFAYDSVEEIDALTVEDNLQEMVRKADKTCRSNFKDGEARNYANLDMLEYSRKNCGDKLVDSLKDCSVVMYTCTKPAQEDLDAALENHKGKLKVKLAAKKARKAKKDECLEIEAKVADGGDFGSLKELAKLYRKECK